MTYQIVSDSIPIIPYLLFYTKHVEQWNYSKLYYDFIILIKGNKNWYKILPLSNELETFLYFFILHAMLLDDW